MYIPRHLEEPIRAASRAYPVVMLCGQRQVGKSTLLRHIAGPERRAVTLDDLSALRLAQIAPARAVDVLVRLMERDRHAHWGTADAKHYREKAIEFLKKRYKNADDPAGALAIAKELGLQPADCWYVGDTSTDMKCGANAGMETIGVLWGYRPREELTMSGARHLVSEPKEIVELATV